MKTVDLTGPEGVLHGHGVLAAHHPAPPGLRGQLEPVLARTYRHPAVPGRVIVKLVQGRVAQSDDAAMGALGLVADEASPVVGQARRRAVGFPAAAITRQPALARFALDILKDFQREARRIRSKPGHALQGFGTLAEELGRSVPDFLPPFWEEAGRAFLGQGASSQAAQCFQKAREAEHIHALDVDEAERHEAFLEFALAGGLSIGSLTDYAKTLERRFSPQVAYERFLTLCRERVLGGVPPWGGMIKELQRLAKGAGVDPLAELEALLLEIFDSPSVAKAPMAFWEGCERALVRLTAREPALHGRLLSLQPQPQPGREDDADRWLALLEATGSLEALVQGNADPAGGAVAVLDRLIRVAHHYRSEIPAGLIPWVRRLAPRLRADGRPFFPVRRRWAVQFDVDLLETALELDVPVQLVDDKGQLARLDITLWAAQASTPGRGLDPVRISLHPELRRPFAQALGPALHIAQVHTAIYGKRGFLEGKRAWCEEMVAAIEAGGLPDAAQTLQTLQATVKPGLFDDIPDLWQRLRDVSLGHALGRTLRAGLYDELHWPILDEAYAKLGKSARMLGPFPNPVVGHRNKILALSRDAVLIEFDPKLPPRIEPEAARWIGSDLAVRYRDGDQRVVWARSGAAGVLQEHFGYFSELDVGQVLDDGAWTEGGRAIRTGELAFPEHFRLVSDGTTLWRVEGMWRDHHLVEVDPRTGAVGRKSLPGFFADQGATEVDLDQSELYVLPAGVVDSPLGQVGSLYGWVRLKGSGEGIHLDGRRHPSPGPGRFSGLLRFPGHDRPATVRHDRGYRASVEVRSPDGVRLGVLSERDEADDFPGLESEPAISAMPLPAWHFLVPRSLADSLRLRAVTDAEAVGLVDGSLGGLGLNDAVLTAVVQKRAAAAGKLADELKATLSAAGPSGGAEVRRLPDWAALQIALAPFIQSLPWSAPNFEDLHRRVQELISGEAQVSKPFEGDLFVGLLGHSGLLSWLAASVAADEGERQALLDLGRWLREAGLPPQARTRILEGIDPEALSKHLLRHELHRVGDSLFVLRENRHYRPDATILEIALGGSFVRLPGVAWREERELRLDAEGVDFDAFAERARASGPAPITPALIEALSQATGLTPAEATLVWAGLPGLRQWNHREFPAKELRESLGLKANAVKDARKALAVRILPDQAIALYQRGFPTGPADLWSPLEGGPTSAVARFAEAFNALFGKRTLIDPELKVRASRELTFHGADHGALVEAFADPAASDLLQKDAPSQLDERDVTRQSEGAPGLHQAHLGPLLGWIAWLWSETPVGDPLRAGIPAVVAAMRARLSAPGLMFGWGNASWDITVGGSAAAEAWRDALPGAIEKIGDHPLKISGAYAIGLHGASGWAQCPVSFFPARLGPPETDVVGPAIRGRISTWGVDPVAAVHQARSPGVTALAARVTETPVPEGGWEANPLASAPEVVAAAARHLGVSPDAAAYYLQLLVVVNPSDARITTRNGWSGATLAAAKAELVSQGLVVEARRARAGRDVFLPGGWIDLAAPHAPLEDWKFNFLGLVKKDGEKFSPPYQAILWFEPIHEVFARALAACVAGQGPRFEEAGASRPSARKARSAKEKP